MTARCGNHGPGKCGHFGQHFTTETRVKIGAALRGDAHSVKSCGKRHAWCVKCRPEIKWNRSGPRRGRPTATYLMHDPDAPLNGRTCACGKGHKLRGHDRRWANADCYHAGKQRRSSRAPTPPPPPSPPKPKPRPSVGVVTHVFPDHTYASGGEAWVLLDGTTDEIYVSYARSKLVLVEGDRVRVELTKKSTGEGKVVQNLSRQSSEVPTWRSGFPLRSCGKRHSFCRVCRPRERSS